MCLVNADMGCGICRFFTNNLTLGEIPTKVFKRYRYWIFGTEFITPGLLTISTAFVLLIQVEDGRRKG